MASHGMIAQLNLVEQSEQQRADQSITALPHHLLKLILISESSIRDKKALRQTCNFIQCIIDEALTCIKLNAYESRRVHENRQCMVKLLGRLEHCHDLKTIDLAILHGASSLLKHLPTQLTMLRLSTYDIDITVLARLPQLTSLYLQNANGEEYDAEVSVVTGIEHVTGLTRLQTYKPIVGSVAHLAPTLKHLFMLDYFHVQGVAALTNLEALEVRRNLPHTFFRTNSHIAIKNLCIGLEDCPDFFGSSVWQLAPKTLTRLTLDHSRFLSLLLPLPKTITHLQFAYADPEMLQQAADALPGMKRLDFQGTDWIWSRRRRNEHLGSHLCKLTNLQSMSILMDNGFGRVWPHQDVFSMLPELADLVARGVEVNVMRDKDELLGVFLDTRWTSRSEWARQV